MHFCVCGYNDINRTGRTPAMIRTMREVWQEVAHKHDCGLSFYEPSPYMIHGELLNRMWLDIRYNIRRGNNFVAISEIDFIPDSAMPNLVTDYFALNPRLRALLTPYVTRDTPDHSLRHYTTDKDLPLIAPWFMALNLAGLETWPSLDWLAAGGPRNDAGNLALQNALESGFLTEENYLAIKPRDLRQDDPDLWGLELPGYGAHVFFSQRYDEDPSYELVPGTGHTVGRHLGGITRFLARRAAAEAARASGEGPGKAP